MMMKFKEISNHYEEILQSLLLKTTEISQETEKMIQSVQERCKFDILKMESNYNALLEKQSVKFSKKKTEILNCFSLLMKDLEKTFDFSKEDFENTNLRFQEIKQNRINSKTKHLFALNEFDENLKETVRKIEENQNNFPLKIRTLKKNEEFQLKNNKIPSLGSNKKIEFLREMLLKHKQEKPKTGCGLEASKINDSESEISVFLANQLNKEGEESRLNISMPKDEGKWDPELESDNSDNMNQEYSEIKKAFEIFESYNLFDSVHKKRISLIFLNFNRKT